MLHSFLQQSDQSGPFFPLWGYPSLLLVILAIVAYWKIFTKAGQPSWAAIIPIYNVIVLLRVVGRPWWWLFLMLVPVLNLVILVILSYNLARSFGHGTWFTVGLVFLPMIFALILAFGRSKYLGPAGRNRVYVAVPGH